MTVLDRRLILVTGKGGVGKSTVVATLGLQSAARGHRTLLIETSGAANLPPLFGRSGSGYTPTELSRGLFTLSITPEEAIEDYVLQQIRVKKLFQLVFRNRVMGPFLDAVPGLHDVIQLGKVFDVLREQQGARLAWDRVIVDAPATGHGVTMLGAPAAMMEMTRRGPFFEGARQVHGILQDPAQAAVVLVCLPEEMPVNETVDLWGRLGSAQPLVGLVVLNEIHRPPFRHLEDWPTARGALAGSPRPEVQEALALTDAWVARIERQRAARARLQAELPVKLVELPFLYKRDLRSADLHDLGHALNEGLTGVQR